MPISEAGTSACSRTFQGAFANDALGGTLIYLAQRGVVIRASAHARLAVAENCTCWAFTRMISLKLQGRRQTLHRCGLSVCEESTLFKHSKVKASVFQYFSCVF